MMFLADVIPYLPLRGPFPHLQFLFLCTHLLTIIHYHLHSNTNNATHGQLRTSYLRLKHPLFYSHPFNKTPAAFPIFSTTML